MVKPGEEAAALSAVGVGHGLREQTRMGTLGKTRIAMFPAVIMPRPYAAAASGKPYCRRRYQIQNVLRPKVERVPLSAA
jgi:hypothetical protein